jgi:hypothetical protein
VTASDTIEKYNSRSARVHIKRLVEILENPCVLSNHSQIRRKSRSRSHSHSSQDGKTEQHHDFEKEYRELIVKKNQDFQTLVQEHQKDPVKMPGDRPTKNQLSKSIKDIQENALARGDLNRLKHVKCIESIQYS